MGWKESLDGPPTPIYSLGCHAPVMTLLTAAEDQSIRLTNAGP